jgi:hypothetical protein
LSQPHLSQLSQLNAKPLYPSVISLISASFKIAARGKSASLVVYHRGPRVPNGLWPLPYRGRSTTSTFFFFLAVGDCLFPVDLGFTLHMTYLFCRRIHAIKASQAGRISSNLFSMTLLGNSRSARMPGHAHEIVLPLSKA